MSGVSPIRPHRHDPEIGGTGPATLRQPRQTEQRVLQPGLRHILAQHRPNVASFVAAERAKSVAPSNTGERSKVQRALDAFMARANASYRVGSETVRVSPGFRMNEGYGPSVAKAAAAIAKRLPTGTVAMSTIGRVVSGKGTPEQVQKVTQALIDAGALRDFAGDTPEKSIRGMMFHYGIGNDCSGYTYQAHASVKGARFDPDVAPGRLVSRDARDARPGDIMRLIAANGARGAGSGHKVIVYSHEVRPAGSPPPRVPNRPEVPGSFTAGGPVHVFELDSSWGGGPRADFGGVERHVWLLNAKTGKWGHFDSQDRRFVVSASGPYNHRLEGVYR